MKKIIGSDFIMKILNSMKEFDINKIFTGDEIYIKDLEIKINFYQNFTKITDLKNAAG